MIKTNRFFPSYTMLFDAAFQTSYRFLDCLPPPVVPTIRCECISASNKTEILVCFSLQMLFSFSTAATHVKLEKKITSSQKSIATIVFAKNHSYLRFTSNTQIVLVASKVQAFKEIWFKYLVS